MPIVSVVIPTFGRPPLLLRAVRSVLAQSFADLELLIVIDGTDPDTLAALAGVDDPRLRILSHPQKLGAGQTRDDGALAARGQWVAFLDDDDEWLPEKLAHQLALPLDDHAIVMSRSRVVTPEGSFIWPTHLHDGTQPFDEWLFDRRSWLRESGGFLQTSSLLLPRRLFQTLRFTDTRQHEEWELVLRAIKHHGYRLHTAPEPDVIHYRASAATSLSRSYTAQRSLDWIDGLGPLVTPRAYAGFCLLVVARTAATADDHAMLPKLLARAFRHGRPTARQLFAFALIWLLPDRARRRLRARLSRNRAPA